MLHAERPARLQLSQRASYALVAATIFLIFFASTVPSALYPLYQQRWHFTNFALTTVFAVYAVGVLLSLLLVGRLSDVIGRRPVMLPALGALVVATILFATARGLPWLFVARFVQGVATGALSGTVSAAITDLEPSGDPQRAALVNSISFTSGSALGPLFGGVMLQFAPVPTVVPFGILSVLFAAVLCGVVVMREPLPESARFGQQQNTSVIARPAWWPRRPSVPHAMRSVFLAAATSIIASWMSGSIFAALGSSITGSLLHLHNAVLGGLAYCLLAGAGGVTQIVFRALDVQRAQIRGAQMLMIGMLFVMLSTLMQLSALFFGGVIAIGVGFGLAFMGGTRAIANATPPQQRAEVISAYFVVGYLAMTIPVMAGGRLVDVIGLHNTLIVFALVVMVVSAGSWLVVSRLSSQAKNCKEHSP